jgi:hypothetical protein
VIDLAPIVAVIERHERTGGGMAPSGLNVATARRLVAEIERLRAMSEAVA